MTTITEDYVDFEIAKLLKEKGFDEDIDLWYDENGEIFFRHHYDISSDWRVKVQQKVYLCPTLQMAMKWLRDIKNIHIIINPYTDKEGQHWSFIFDKYAYGCWQELGIYITDSWNTYEKAAKVAIKYCLENLI